MCSHCSIQTKPPYRMSLLAHAGQRMSRWTSPSCAFRRAPHHQLVRQQSPRYPVGFFRHCCISRQPTCFCALGSAAVMQLVDLRRRNTAPSTRHRLQLPSCRERCYTTAAPSTGELARRTECWHGHIPATLPRGAVLCATLPTMRLTSSTACRAVLCWTAASATTKPGSMAGCCASDTNRMSSIATLPPSKRCARRSACFCRVKQCTRYPSLADASDPE